MVAYADQFAGGEVLPRTVDAFLIRARCMATELSFLASPHVSPLPISKLARVPPTSKTARPVMADRGRLAA